MVQSRGRSLMMGCRYVHVFLEAVGPARLDYPASHAGRERSMVLCKWLFDAAGRYVTSATSGTG